MIDKETEQFLLSLKEQIKSFLDRISKNNFSYFKYSYSGDILDSSKKWGLGNLVFATKILYITLRLLEELDITKKENIKKITKGKNEPDIHGTIMFVWGLAIINEIMNIGLNYKVPLN